MTEPLHNTPDAPNPRWGKVVDHESCIGCHACSTACKSENEVPLSVNRTYVKYVDVGEYPNARRAFQVTRCNQCADSPCTTACPTSAMFTRPDGIVDFDKDICIGCKACMAACPYDAIFINPNDQTAEKCNFCAHRIDMALEPACVVVCPTEAIMVGDLDDPTSRVAQMVGREPVSVRRPEKETGPKLFYRGAHQATLDPLAARRPEGDLFMWAEQLSGNNGGGAQAVVSGYPQELGDPNSSAAALLSYDVPHKAPWGWMVSMYTLTKSIATGAFLVPLLLLLTGHLQDSEVLWRWTSVTVAGVFLGLTGLLLIADLKQPLRFYMIFTRPQWKSWLVRGAFIIAGYSVILGLHFLGFHQAAWLKLLGGALAIGTAIYTAFLFAQAKARDLWQSPLLPPHLFVQALLAGSAVLLPIAHRLQPEAVAPLSWVLAITSLAHLLLVTGEITLPHVTAHAGLAVKELTVGRFGTFFRMGITFAAIGCAAPWYPIPAAIISIIALGLYEHAYVQAGQAVPLA